MPEEPVGLVLNPGGGQLLRADAETPLSARPGDLLFSGDGLRTSGNTRVVSVLPRQDAGDAEFGGRGSVRRKETQGSDGDDFRAAGAGVHVAENIARRGGEPATLWGHDDARRCG
ncbi:MAG: hypothetical protein WDO18_19125 [Acidobacteriota bacterium]